MSATLTIIEGRDPGRSFPIGEGVTLTIGRSSTSSVRVLDPRSSRNHCTLICQGDEYVLSDLNSTNGTFIDNRPIERRRLQHGDRIHIGHSVLEFTLLEPPIPTLKPVRRIAIRPYLRMLGRAGICAVGLCLALLVFQVTRALFARSFVLEISSEPKGAMVFVDGKYVDQTPVEITRPRGPAHLVKVTKYGYVPWTEEVKPARPRHKLHAALELLPKATLVIASTPPGADVYVDGLLVGATPLKAEVEEGERQVRLQRANYLPWSDKVKARAEKPTEIHQRLTSRMVAFHLAQIEKDENNVKYHTDLAHVYVLEHSFDGAATSFLQALRIVGQGRDTSGYASRLHQELQKVYFKQFDYGDHEVVDQCRRRLDQMFEAFFGEMPGNMTVLNLVSGFYSKTGKLAQSIALHQKCLEKLPNNVEILVKLGSLQLAAHQVAESIATLEKAVGISPTNWAAHYHLGLAFIEKAKARDAEAKANAIEHLTEALSRCTDGKTKGKISTYLAQAKAL